MNVFLTGLTGQDGSYAAEKLITRGHRVYAFVRHVARSSVARRLMGHPRLSIICGDLADYASIDHAFRSMPPPDWVLNYGALSPVWPSWDQPHTYLAVNAGGLVGILECVRKYAPGAKVYQAGSSEQFGKVTRGEAISESTPFAPQSPYAVSKVAAHEFVKCYRDSYGLHASVGIAFNHESERRGGGFVTQKIATAAARIQLGKQKTLKLGNIQAVRDWSYAPEVVEAAFLMLESPTPDDYVIGSGTAHTVEEFGVAAFEAFGLDFHTCLEHDARFERPADVEYLEASPKRIKKALGWQVMTSFIELVKIMVFAAYEREQ